MLDAIEKLLILQERDLKIRRTENELTLIGPQREALNERMAGTQKALDDAKLQANKLESQRKEFENAVEAKKGQISKYSQQQLETKKNEEYRALANEIDTCKKQISDLEDQQLELMEEAEELNAKLAGIKVECAKLKADVQQQIEGLGDREKELDSQLEELKSDRADLAAAVEASDPSALSKYERLLKQKDRPVVEVTHGICGGCRLKLPPQEVVSSAGGSEIVTCPNCARILYSSGAPSFAEPA